MLRLIRCPRCRAADGLSLEVTERDEREVRSGTVHCASCGHDMRIERGVLDLMHDPPEFVRREAGGLARFAEEMRATGWDRERILALPRDELDYWKAQVGRSTTCSTASSCGRA